MKLLCYKCDTYKDTIEFYTDSRLSTGYQSNCKTCTKQRVEENREARRNNTNAPITPVSKRVAEQLAQVVKFVELNPATPLRGLLDEIGISRYTFRKIDHLFTAVWDGDYKLRRTLLTRNGEPFSIRESIGADLKPSLASFTPKHQRRRGPGVNKEKRRTREIELLHKWGIVFDEADYVLGDIVNIPRPDGRRRARELTPIKKWRAERGYSNAPENQLVGQARRDRRRHDYEYRQEIIARDFVGPRRPRGKLVDHEELVPRTSPPRRLSADEKRRAELMARVGALKFKSVFVGSNPFDKLINIHARCDRRKNQYV